MKENIICIKCGSSSIVSDRSLGGRMVCFKCGSTSFRKKSFFSTINKKLIYFVMAIIVIFIIII